MSLTLHAHPLSSYCQKALIALYENDTPFENHFLDLGNEAVRTAFRKLWPIGKMPLLRDHARDRTVVESTVVIEYLAQYYPGKSQLIPADPEVAWQVRMRDRFFDLYVNDQVGKIVTDKFRPAGQNDGYGVEQAKATLETAYGILDEELAGHAWAVGDSFTMADCAAAPALFYAMQLVPVGSRKHVAAYFGRLRERPSFARASKEAEPYLALFPK
ncbi:MAG: glutathione S-transferase family protein [Polyangiales bacterium]